MKKIYFAGAIRGGRENAEIYAQMIKKLKEKYIVLTEHVGNEKLLSNEKFMTYEQIYERDKAWLDECDVLVAEVSTPSLGIGYELAYVEKLGKPIICIVKEETGNKLSAMVAGNKNFTIIKYNNLEVLDKVSEIIDGLKK